jgi:hypothetical protein
MSGGAGAVPDDTPIHRIGGGSPDNLALKPAEAALLPPGISVLAGSGPAEAAAAMRRYFPRLAPSGATIVGSTTAGQVRLIGFDVIMKPSRRLPSHARLIHPDGSAGFSEENLAKLAGCFVNHTGL